MKNGKLLFVLLALLLVAMFFVACNPYSLYKITANDDMDFTVTVGEEIDFTEYFKIKSAIGEVVPVKVDMLDLSAVNMDEVGSFDVKCSYGGATCIATFTVVSGSEHPATFSEIAELYNSYDKWNFVVEYSEIENNVAVYRETYKYQGEDFANTYMGYDENEEPIGYFTDYLQFDKTNNCYCYYEDNGDGTYSKYGEETEEYAYGTAYMIMLELTTLNDFEFTESESNVYKAVNPVAVGNEIMGELSDGYYYAEVAITVENGKISKIECVLNDGSICRFEFSEYGVVNFDISKLNLGSGQGGSGDSTSLTTTFTDENMGVGNGELEYTASVAPFGFDYERGHGLQFLQKNGATTLTSKTSVDDVTSVTVSVYTNNTASMKVSVFVGNTALLCEGNQFAKPNATTETDLVFVADSAVSGEIKVTLTPNGSNKSMYISKIAINGSSVGGGSVEQPLAFTSIASQYNSYDKWNFVIAFNTYYQNQLYDAQTYKYQGDDLSNTYTAYNESDQPIGEFTDYLEYDAENNCYWYYLDNGDGTYTKYGETDAEFQENISYIVMLELTTLNNFKFNEVDGNTFVAVDAVSVGNEMLGELYEGSYVSVTISVASGKIATIEVVCDDGYSYSFEFSGYGTVNLDFSALNSGSQGGGGNQGGGGSQGGGDTPTNVMENQVYNPSNFVKKNLQDRMLESDGSIGLPSTGTYNALVIPVQFVGTSITQSQLDDLNKAFNGTSADTGWESVSSYYKKSSYGALNITYDIQSVYNTSYNAQYYSSYQKQVDYGGQTATQTGEEVILMEVLAYYENILDLTKYDSNNDGSIDAVYLIYSAPVDYDNADFFWAYVTWFYGEQKYDGLDAYYYLFAGFDFMYEDAGANANMKEYAYAGGLDGLKINASTYIHETGHLLGLDDYYDYEKDKGSNEGLGGADMMDATVGDHGAYSKIMLGWAEPTIVTTTQTITIKSLQASGNCILIPLNFNNSYFSEYLLIDLYSAEGLNAMHASPNGSYLYDGASFGARIYHVSSEITDPYNNDYSSFTANNNTSSTYALIKLVEADGEKKFASTNGNASQNDLWHTGDVLSDVFTNYKRNDGKTINFDISFDLVSKDSLKVTITFTAQA